MKQLTVTRDGRTIRIVESMQDAVDRWQFDCEQDDRLRSSIKAAAGLECNNLERSLIQTRQVDWNYPRPGVVEITLPEANDDDDYDDFAVAALIDRRREERVLGSLVPAFSL